MSDKAIKEKAREIIESANKRVRGNDPRARPFALDGVYIPALVEAVALELFTLETRVEILERSRSRTRHE